MVFESSVVVFMHTDICRFFFRITICFLLSLVGFKSAFAHDSKILPKIVGRIADSVVSVSIIKTIEEGAGIIPLLNDDGSIPLKDKPRKFRKVRSGGAGFIIDASGLIVTNDHIIKNAEKITVGLRNGRHLKARIVGRDPKLDIALLKVKSRKRLKPVKFADSRKVRIGAPVFSAGYRFSTSLTISSGVVSALSRNINSGPYDDYIQTDANITGGHGGGPLFNMNGEVIGINTAIITPSGSHIGIGFSVPSDSASLVVAQLRKYGETRRGWLGVRIQSVTDEIAKSLGLESSNGVLVAGVNPDGPAGAFGIEPGDIILKFNGKLVPRKRDFPRMVAETAIGQTVDVEVFRKGKKKTIAVKLGRLEDGEIRTSLEKKSKKRILGMMLSPLTVKQRKKYKGSARGNGVYINSVKRNSPAAKKGIRKGNVIIEVNQKVVRSPSDIVDKIHFLRNNGKKAVLILLYDNKGIERFVAVGIK